MITNVVSPALIASIADVVSNVTATAGVVDGAAAAICAPAFAGTDEASILATTNTTAHSANFLGVSAQGFMEMARYAGAVGYCDASYAMVDDANATMF